MRSLRALVCISVVLACSPATSRPSPADDGAIARVLSGLRTKVVVEGRIPIDTFTLAERMAHYRVPGVSIAVVHGGQLAWAHGFGVKEVGTADSVTASTLFQAASISKPVAATAMLRIVEQGELELDRPINDYLRSWQVPESRFTATEKVTLRRIVSHSAGLTVHGFPGYAAGKPIPTLPEILDGKQPANTPAVRVDTVPGDVYRYSGGGVTIEQLVLSEVTGEPFPVLLQRLVLDPIGMTNSTYEQPLPRNRRGEEAAGHAADGSSIPGRWHTYPEMAAAGLWTTPTDLLSWAVEITAARAGRSTKLLAREMATEMLTLQSGRTGLGPTLGGVGPAFHFGHGGANAGFRCQLIYFPETGQGAAVMTNGERGGALAREILLAIGAEYQWPGYAVVKPVPADTILMARYVGKYVVTRPAPITLVITQERDRMFMEAPGLIDRQELILTAPGRAIALDSGIELSFHTDDAGPAHRVETLGYVLTRTHVAD